jgi:hypothetical protein
MELYTIDLRFLLWNILWVAIMIFTGYRSTSSSESAVQKDTQSALIDYTPQYNIVFQTQNKVEYGFKYHFENWGD